MNRRAGFVLALAAAIALVLLAWRVGGIRFGAPPPAVVSADTTQVGLRSVTLWFANENGDSLVSEVRETPEQEGLHERVSQLVDALARGPEHGGVAVMPAGTSVLHVYLDDRGTLTLDLSRAFQQGFHGGTRGEELVIGSLMRTLASNLPEVKQVLVVCGGAPIASLGGHLPLDRPIDPNEGF